MLYDAIVATPQGFDAVVAEFQALGLSDYVVDGDTQRIGNGIDWFGYENKLAYLRAEKEVIDALHAIPWTTVQVLAVGPLGSDLYAQLAGDSRYESVMPPVDGGVQKFGVFA